MLVVSVVVAPVAHPDRRFQADTLAAFFQGMHSQIPPVLSTGIRLDLEQKSTEPSCLVTKSSNPKVWSSWPYVSGANASSRGFAW